MAINISMSNFQIRSSNSANIIDTGQIDAVIQYIGDLSGDNKFEAGMECLSQTLSMKGDFKGQCESK